ncbi:hypothetical protein [uncultured Thiodictyon sp.]|uniref:hypothetical protein n=1 Tax=uncultured Thiodictyon sp. TaxID=1846217 RepID=UPI0025D83F9C|nr:hypothetical protein [uncultured Thiodictyon sp.]
MNVQPLSTELEQLVIDVRQRYQVKAHALEGALRAREELAAVPITAEVLLSAARQLLNTPVSPPGTGVRLAEIDARICQLEGDLNELLRSAAAVGIALDGDRPVS